MTFLDKKSAKNAHLQSFTYLPARLGPPSSRRDVAASAGLTVLHHIKHQVGRIALAGVRTHAEYVLYYNTYNVIDRNDHGSADYSVTFRTNRFYLCIYCRGLDMVVHCLFQIVCYCATDGIGPKEWKVYPDKHEDEGRHEFQIDLAIDIMNYALSLDWDGNPDNRPDYVREDAFNPCDCKTCLFCVHGLTT